MEKTGFEESEFDQLVFPFIQDPSTIKRHMAKIPINRFKLDKKYPTKAEYAESVDSKDFVGGSKPDILVDDTTKEFIDDPNHLFNLTLSKYPSRQTIYLGRLLLGHKTSN